MAPTESFASYVLEQLEGTELLASRKMFGEYAVYADGKVVALICGDQLYVKYTEAGRAFIGTPVEAAPYPGAKPWFLIDENLDSRAWLCELVALTASEAAPPKPKKPRARKVKTPSR